MLTTLRSMTRICLSVLLGVAAIVAVLGLLVRQPSFRVTPFQGAERADPARLEAHVRFLPDHRNDWFAGFHAVMVTDTAYLRNPRYHTSLDLPETLDYRRTASVVDGVVNAILSFQLSFARGSERRP